MFENSTWLHAPSSSESLMPAGIQKVPTVCPAQGEVVSDLGETRSGILLVKRGSGDGRCKGTVRVQGPYHGSWQQVIALGLRSSTRKGCRWPSGGLQVVACTAAPRPCLSPTPGSSVNNPTSPGKAQLWHLHPHDSMGGSHPQAKR